MKRSLTVFVITMSIAFVACGGGDSDLHFADTLDYDSYDSIYNDDGGFVIIYEMLDKRFNKITFPGTHNSYAGAEWPSHVENQDLTIAEQLENGIRYIEFDIDKDLYVNHNGFWSGYLNERLDQIKSYVRTHPKQVFTIRIADLSPTTFLSGNAPSPEDAYRKMNAKLIERGLGQYIYNWDSIRGNDDPLKCYIPDPWPTLREMIDSGRNVMFFHHRDYNGHGVFDEGVFPVLTFGETEQYYFYSATKLELLSKMMPIWSPPLERQKDGPDRLFLIEVTPDGGATAGDKEDASKNNDGRKLYQLARQHEDEILPDNRAINFINVDYFMTSHAGSLPIDVVDACNRLNYERFNIGWEKSEFFWELYPYEFDDSRNEVLSQLPAIKSEVAEVIDDYENKRNLDGHEDSGKIVSTTYETDHFGLTLLEYPWYRLPEWAVDNDLFTRWCGSSSRPDHTWGIDLGARKFMDEIAIAWEFSHKGPAYIVYVSNDDDRFADGISRDELINDDGWMPVVIQSSERPNIVPLEPWDRRTIDLDSLGLESARYVKIKVTDADPEYWPSFYEVRIYQSLIQVVIDIKPGSEPNSINLGSKGVIPVSVLTTDDFDATMVDGESCRFGPNEAEPEHYAIEDIDIDGALDMIFHFRTQQSGIDAQDTEATLTCQTQDGWHINGDDSIRIVP
jgi:hypothetical protein